MTDTKNTVSDELLGRLAAGFSIDMAINGRKAAQADADMKAAAAALRASIPGGVGVKVMLLEWHKSEIIGWNGDWHTVPTAYSIRCADENGLKWSGFGGFGYERSDEAAKAAAQADYERRILSALSTSAEEVEAKKAPPFSTKPMVFMTSADEGVLFDPQGKFHGWAMRQHPDGLWISVRKLDAKDPEDNPLLAVLSPSPKKED